MRIRELRKANDITLDQLATKTGYTADWISFQESNPRPLWTNLQLQAIAKALGCMVEELFEEPADLLELEGIDHNESEGMLRLSSDDLGVCDRQIIPSEGVYMGGYLVIYQHLLGPSEVDYIERDSSEPVFVARPKPGESILVKKFAGELSMNPKPDLVEEPEWAIVYGKLEKRLESIPYDSNGVKQGCFAPRSGPLLAESVSVSQDGLGFISVVGFTSYDLLFSAHPKGGCKVFVKGDWLNDLNEVTS